MADRKDSRRARAVRTLLGGASRLAARGRIAEGGDPGEATVRDRLLIEAQQATFREMHRRFTERADLGDGGLAAALDALDAMWLNVRALRAGAPAIMGTLASEDERVKARLARFYSDSTGLLEDAIRHVFAADLGLLAVPPERMAVLVRIMLEGLVIELAQARTQEEVALVDQAYGDLRALFERFVLLGADGPEVPALELEPIPLPW